MHRSSDFDGMIYMVGDDGIIEGMERIPALPIFSEEACGFLSELSKTLLASADAKAYADIVTFAFWCRKNSLKRMAETYIGLYENTLRSSPGRIQADTCHPARSEAKSQDPLNVIDKKESSDCAQYDERRVARNRIGRGVAFHIAPSNVPVNFAYTLAAGLLAGNANIVKPPSADFPQTEIIADAIVSCLDARPEMRPYIALVKYDRQRNITDALSALCNTRIVWGGNETVAEIRKSPLPPRATELTFPNRHSMLIIDAGGYLAIEDKDSVAADFFNDTFLTDQNACSSPRMVAWTCGMDAGPDDGTVMNSGVDTQVSEPGGSDTDRYSEIAISDDVVEGAGEGNNVKDAGVCTGTDTSKPNDLIKKEILKTAKCEFWSHAADIISQKYELQPAQAVKKLTESYLYSAAHPDAHVSTNGGNLIYRIEVDRICADIMNHYGDSGYFFEYDIAKSLDEILPLLDTSFQTLSYLGIPTEILREFIMGRCPRGVDRIVKVGHVMDFDIVWDGYDLIAAMSRVVDVR